jgi:hypothetical protein
MNKCIVIIQRDFTATFYTCIYCTLVRLAPSGVLFPIPPSPAVVCVFVCACVYAHIYIYIFIYEIFIFFSTRVGTQGLVFARHLQTLTHKPFCHYPVFRSQVPRLIPQFVCCEQWHSKPDNASIYFVW